MKKILLRTLLLLTAAVLCLSAVSCQNKVDVPDGMQLCSEDHLEYYFFVPTSWVDNTVSGSTSAFVTSNGKHVVSVLVTSYVPEEALDIAGYWDICEEEYVKVFDNFVLISPAEGTETTVSDMNATEFVYTADLAGESYKYNQTIFVHNGRFYTITYTATPDSYDTYLSDLAAMKANFTFR